MAVLINMAPLTDNSSDQRGHWHVHLHGEQQVRPGHGQSRAHCQRATGSARDSGMEALFIVKLNLLEIIVTTV